MEKIYTEHGLSVVLFDKKMREQQAITMDEHLAEALDMLEKGELKLKAAAHHMKARATLWLLATAINIYNQDWDIILNDT